MLRPFDYLHDQWCGMIFNLIYFQEILKKQDKKPKVGSVFDCLCKIN